MVNSTTLSSAEIGTLWMTYQQKTLILRYLEYFMEVSDDPEAKNIMGGLWQELNPLVDKIEKIFINEGAEVPDGFTNHDVNLKAPKLYEDGFDIMFLRIFKELSMGMYSISMNMSYREDVISLYNEFTSLTQKTYRLATDYLLEREILTLPPKVTMPKMTKYINSKSYLNGFNLFNDKRALNDLEIGILHHGVETNIIGKDLIIGFANCTKNNEIKTYFIKGKELAEKQIKIFSETLLQNNIEFSVSLGNSVTNSAIAPFSDKLMMYCIYLLNGFGIVGNSFGTMFTLRNDLVLDSGLIVKDIFLYNKEGIKLMIKNGWMEEPPQAADGI